MLRCEICKKKCIIHFKCKCSKVHCIKHQLPENHECEYKVDLFKIEICEPLIKLNYI